MVPRGDVMRLVTNLIPMLELSFLTLGFEGRSMLAKSKCRNTSKRSESSPKSPNAHKLHLPERQHVLNLLDKIKVGDEFP
jgi:hypothetical protein